MLHPLRLGGIVADLVFIAFGAGAAALGLGGRHEVSTDVTREQIVGTPDMKPSLLTGIGFIFLAGGLIGRAGIRQRITTGTVPSTPAAAS